MGTVVPFVPRPARGDWSSGERARLAELTDRLTAGGARVDAAFGLSDRGDPWCVITDERDEVLVHVARIGGRFVVHDAASDAVQDEDSLWRAFDRLLGDAWRAGRPAAAITPLRAAQSLLAVAAALVFVHEIDPGLAAPHATGWANWDGLRKLLARLAPATAGHHSAIGHSSSDPDHPAGGPQAQATRASGPMDDRWPGDHLTAAIRDTAPNLAAAAHGAGSLLRVAADKGVLLAGGAGDDLLIGGPGGDHLVGGDGADTLIGGGARPGELDVLEGGRGDDRLTMAARTVAIGGEGKNVFVITSASDLTAAGPGLDRTAAADGGTILDFTRQDRFEFAAGPHPTVVGITPEADVLAGLHGYAALAHTAATAGVRVGFDLNGDGRADVYVSVAGPGAASLTLGWQPGTEHPIAVAHPSTPGGFLLGS